MLFKSDTLSRIYTKSGTEILLFRFSRLWYALTSKQQYNNPRHIVHTVFQCFGYHEFTRFRKTKTFSGAKVLLFSDLCKRKGLFYIFCGHFGQIYTLKAAEAALTFLWSKKNVPPIWREILFLFRSQIKRIERILRIFLFLPVIKILSLMIYWLLSISHMAFQIRL
jgi:hypothetical protein